MKRSTTQSVLNFTKRHVRKTYKQDGPFFDYTWFDHEVTVIERFNGSDYFVGAFGFDHKAFSYQMKRYDCSLGNAAGLARRSLFRIFFTMTVEEINYNLRAILNELKSFGIDHRDINPGNLIYSESERRIRLTDFFWSRTKTSGYDLPEPTYLHPWLVNDVYGNDDVMAMNKIMLQIVHLNEVTFYHAAEMLAREFKISSGSSGYRDGSVVSRGYSYHPVDTPFTKGIFYHKGVCVHEYHAIKDALPIIPETVMDIGAAGGYFSFNLIRDYHIKRLIAYEADNYSRDLLVGIKNLCWLTEMGIRKFFDDSTKIYPSDLVIWLNSHMWIHKQLGRDNTLALTARVIASSKYMFFQTCGAYSSGMYRIPEYNCREDIEAMLYEAGAMSVQIVGEFVGSHDLPRHLFLVEGGLSNETDI